MRRGRVLGGGEALRQWDAERRETTRTGRVRTRLTAASYASARLQEERATGHGGGAREGSASRPVGARAKMCGVVVVEGDKGGRKRVRT